MERPEPHVELGKRLLETLRSLIMHLPENVQGNIDSLKKMLESPNQSQILIPVLLGVGLLFQVFLKFVRSSSSAACVA